MAASMSDLVAKWELALADGLHIIEFEHGTTSGKRVIWVDRKEIYRKEWMFKLVGKESFRIGNKTCIITIDAVSGFAYEYTLQVDGKSLQKFCDNQRKSLKVWRVPIKGCDHRICLDTEKLEVWVNGEVMDCYDCFSEDCDGSERHFIAAGHSGHIKIFSSGKRRQGLIYKLYLDDIEIPESPELNQQMEQCACSY